MVFVVASLLAISSRPQPHARRRRRNPFQVPRRRLEDTSTSSGIRYLSLGGASTWGVGLLEPEPIVTVDSAGVTTVNTREAAYPYRLSPEVHNAAQRVGGPTLAALCTQSIVEENVFDVITLEFSNAYQESDLVALELLAQRLRTRFPRAVIVLVQLWSPSHYYFESESDGEIVDFATWRRHKLDGQRETQGEDWTWDSLDWQDSVQERGWKYSPMVASATSRLQHLADQVKGHFVHLAPPQDPIHGLQTANKWFIEFQDDLGVGLEDKDSSLDPLQYTLSSKGHLVVASHIRSVVDQATLPLGSLDERNKLGDWGSGDQCQLWFDYDPNGEKAAVVVPKHSSNLVLRPFANDKYSLEVSRKGGSIVLENSFDEDRMLYLTYMTASVAQNAVKTYPQVQVQLFQEGHALKKGKGVIVDPHYDDDDHRHATRTTAIGHIPAHSLVEIRLRTLQDSSSPFRLVGASLFSKEKAQWQIATEFDLEPERVYEGRRLFRMLGFF